VPGDAAHHHRETHQRKPGEHPPGRGLQQALADLVHPDPLEREQCQPAAEQRRDTEAGAPRELAPAALRLGDRRLQRRQVAVGLHAREPVGRTHAGAHGEAVDPAHWRRGGDLDRVLVGAQHLPGHVRPGVARCVLGRGVRHRSAALVVDREIAQRLGQRGRVAAREQHAVDAVTHDVAVAGDVGGDDRRARGEGLREDHPEALAAQRRRGQHVRAREDGLLRGVVDLAQRLDVPVVHDEVGDLGGPGAHQRQPRRHDLAQRLEGAQQHRQTLALHGLADEDDLERVGRAGGDRRLGGYLDAIGDHAVVATEEPAPRPRGGLRDGDPHRQPVQPPARAEQVGDVVRDAVVGVAVERADERDVARTDDVPAHHRRDRLVDVHHVEVARLQLAAQGRYRVRRAGQIRHRAVGRVAHRAPQRHEIVRQLALLRPGAAM
jgi:hypothetical protein